MTDVSHPDPANDQPLEVTEITEVTASGERDESVRAGETAGDAAAGQAAAPGARPAKGAPAEVHRGTPPNQKELSRTLGPLFAVWDGAIAMGKEFEATWRWMHSEQTGRWSLRAYLPGDRFFVALSLQGRQFEASLNLKTEEWDAIPGDNAAEQERLALLREKAIASGDDPAWVHFRLEKEGDLSTLAKLLFARGRRSQPPREKKKTRRRR